MNILPTPKALRWLDARDAKSDSVKRALLSSSDSHRNVIELESFARAIGLEPGALERLRSRDSSSPRVERVEASLVPFGKPARTAQ